MPFRRPPSPLLTRRDILGAALPTIAATAAGTATATAAPQERQFDEQRRIPAEEAHQAVAADERFLYAIGNHVIGKYEKQSGKRFARWQCEAGKPLMHLDSGVVRNGTLYCAHSNYPGVPMVSSIERWNAETLAHEGSWSLGILGGSATWVDFRDGNAYVTFAHYAGNGGEPNHDPRWTTLIKVRHRMAPSTSLGLSGSCSLPAGADVDFGWSIYEQWTPDLYRARQPGAIRPSSSNRRFHP